MADESVPQLLKRVLMVPPKHFTVEYSINPWMGGTVDQSKAMQQWNELKAAIEKQGVEVLTLEQVEGLPDMVFVCNSGLVLGNKVYLSKFHHKERTGEQEHYLKWFKEHGFEVIGDDYPEFFEGGGDACFSTYKTLWAGYGYRSTESKIRW
ncbi:hypothetical protein AB6A40_006478 [Gnathostoma spinigerum]|uniref:Amidinotransferase n=1 Tax=Gnathostoma spinigerum TaxID=75299 RepID=A0ABD6EIH2_9BILA